MKQPLPKLPFVILLLFLVALASVLVWNSGDNGDAPPSAPTAQPEDGPEIVAPLAADLATVADEPEATDYQPPEGLSRIELSVADGVVRHLVVQVWDRKAGNPAAEASVFVLDGFEGPELGDPFAQHWSDLAESRGQRFKTDPQGRVELPPVVEWAIVTAQSPGAYGFAKVGPEHRDVETIILRTDETVTVRVTDGQDRTVAGVPVGVVQRVPVRDDPAKLRAQLKEIQGQMARVRAYIQENPSQREAAMPRVQSLRQRQGKVTTALRQAEGGDRRGDGRGGQRRAAPRERKRPEVTTRVEVRARRRTDEDGIAVFRHFQVYRHNAQRWWPPPHVDQFEAVLLMPLQQPESRAFAGRPVPEETLELRLPATGSIALRTVDRDGRPFTHPVHADLRMHETPTVPWARVQMRKEQNEESIVFPFVGLGLQFIAHCRLDDEDFRWTAPPFPGPSNPGERVTVDLVVTPNEGMLYGRLLDSADEPLAGVHSTFLINSSAGRLEGEEVTLDDGGRFHLPFQVRPQHRAPFRLEIRRDDVRPTQGLATPMPAPARGQVTDLGDLRLGAFGQIAHGIAVDDRGLPIASATVQLQRERDVGDQQPRLEFVDEAFTLDRTDDEGRYELFGDLEPGRYRLRAEAKEHFPFESRDLQRGDRIDPKLDRKSRIVGTVLKPDWLASQRVRVHMRSVAGPEQREDQVHDHEGKTYVFFDWVKPGIYDLSLRVRDFPDPFLRVDRLELLPGQQGLHPRLKDLDLSAYLSRFEIFAFDDNGQNFNPDRPLLAQIVRPDGRTAAVGFPWKNGRIEVISASSHLEVMPLASGFCAEPTVLTQGRCELRFLRLPPVDLQVPGLGQLTGTTPVLMLMQLVGDADLPQQLEKWDGLSGRMSGWWDGRAKYSSAPMGEGDTARMKLMCGGRYRVAMLLGRGTGVRAERVDLEEVTVRLVPGAGPQRVIVNAELEPVLQALIVLTQRQAANQQNGK